MKRRLLTAALCAAAAWSAPARAEIGDPAPERAAAELARALRERQAARAKELERIDGEVKELQSTVDALTKKLSGFEQSERAPVSVATKWQEGWKKEREQLAASIVNFPERQQGSIVSGRALNLMVETMGPMALQAQRAKGQMSAGANDLFVFEPIPPALLRDLSLVVNLPGHKAGGDFFDIAWVPLLRRREFDDFRKRFEDARDQGLAELREGRPASIENIDGMRLALDGIVRALRDGQQNGRYGHLELMPAYSQAGKRLAEGIRRFENASRADLLVAELPSDGSLKTIQDLLAFLYERNFRFGVLRQDDDRRVNAAQQVLLKLRLHYYDLKVLSATLDNTKDRLKGALATKERFRNALVDSSEFEYVARTAKSEADRAAAEAMAELIRAMAKEQ